MNGWFLVGEFWGLYLTPFVFFFCLLFFCGSCKRIKTEGEKTEIPLYSDFILELTAILWWECFPKPIEIDTIPPDYALKYRIIFSNYKFKGPSCISLQLAGYTVRC